MKRFKNLDPSKGRLNSKNDNEVWQVMSVLIEVSGNAK